MSSYIHSPTNSLENSIDFYTRLNYKDVSTTSFTRFTDGKITIEINPDRKARPGIKLVKATWTKEVERLQKLVQVLHIENGFLLRDYNGVWYYLIERPDEEQNAVTNISFGLTGNCFGVCVESTELEKSIELLKILGFKVTSENLGQGYVNFENNDKLGYCLLGAQQCPHLFFNPSLTFFNGKNNLELIEKIRKSGVGITEEISHFNKEGIVDNIIIRDPGGYGFFIFND